MAVQLNLMNGRDRRELSVWIKPANTSLPVPVSPRISTAASVVATCSTRRITPCSAALCPTMPGAGADGASPVGSGRAGIPSRSSLGGIGSGRSQASYIFVMVPSSLSSGLSAQPVENLPQGRRVEGLVQELDRSRRACRPSSSSLARPVRNTTGIWSPRSARRRWTSRPSMSGIRTSSTRQQTCSSATASRNARPDRTPRRDSRTTG